MANDKDYGSDEQDDQRKNLYSGHLIYNVESHLIDLMWKSRGYLVQCIGYPIKT